MLLSCDFHKTHMPPDPDIFQPFHLSTDQQLNPEMISQVNHRSSLVCLMDCDLLKTGLHNKT